MKRFVYSIICLAVLNGAVFAADDDKTKATVKVVGIQIQKETSDDQIMSFNAGTTIDLLVANTDKFILGIDGKASKLTAFTDSKKTDLTKTKSPFKRDWLNVFFVRMGKGNHQCVFQAYAPTTPAEGSDKIVLQATVALQCGKDEKTAEQKNVILKVGEKVSFAPFSLTVEKGYPEGKQVQAVIVSPERNVKAVEFLDAKGKIIKPTFTNPGMSNKKDQKIEYQTYCGLPPQIEPVTVKVIYFSKMEIVNVPIDLTVGVGF